MEMEVIMFLNITRITRFAIAIVFFINLDVISARLPQDHSCKRLETTHSITLGTAELALIEKIAQESAPYAGQDDIMRLKELLHEFLVDIELQTLNEIAQVIQTQVQQDVMLSLLFGRPKTQQSSGRENLSERQTLEQLIESILGKLDLSKSPYEQIIKDKSDVISSSVVSILYARLPQKSSLIMAMIAIINEVKEPKGLQRTLEAVFAKHNEPVQGKQAQAAIATGLV